MTDRLAYLLMIVMVALVALVGYVGEASARTVDDVVVRCEARPKAVILTWLHGGNQRVPQMLAADRVLIPGHAVKIRENSKGRNRIVRCSTAGSTVRLRTEGGDRWAIQQPVAAPPRAMGTWATATTMYAPVGDDWRVPEVVAAWNAALPQDRQVSLVSTPCGVEPTCISVTAVETIPNSQPNWIGAAFVSIVNDTIVSASVMLDTDTPAEMRAHVTSHEIGHALGLPHWEHPGSVMTSAVDHPEVALPTALDQDWLSSAYSHTP